MQLRLKALTSTVRISLIEAASTLCFCFCLFCCCWLRHRSQVRKDKVSALNKPLQARTDRNTHIINSPDLWMSEDIMASITALRCAAVCARNPARLRAALPSRNLNLQATSEAANLKGIADLPGPNIYKILYWLFVKGYGERSHLLQVGAAAPTSVYQSGCAWKRSAN